MSLIKKRLDPELGFGQRKHRMVALAVGNLSGV